jgi:hypothetical protein
MSSRPAQGKVARPYHKNKRAGDAAQVVEDFKHDALGSIPSTTKKKKKERKKLEKINL